ncbi:MAG: phage portal protein [Oscillospiraceae bacterium]
MAKPNITMGVMPCPSMQQQAAAEPPCRVNSGYGNYGANLTKEHEGLGVLRRQPEEDIEDNINVLRQRSRDAYMGIPTAAAALKTMRTNVIAGGLMPAPQIDGEYLGLTEGEMERLQAQIVREFSLWADTPVCDAERIDNFYQLQQLAFLGYLMNGDEIALLPMKRQVGQPYDLRVQLVEADRVCSPDGFDRLMPCTVQGYKVHSIVQGVETDADGMWSPIGYATITAGQPQPTDADGITWKRVEAYGRKRAEKCLHVMNRERAGQSAASRSWPRFWKQNSSEYTDAEITRR